MLQVSGSAGKVTPGFIPHYTNQPKLTMGDLLKYSPKIIKVFLGSIEFVTYELMLVYFSIFIIRSLPLLKETIFSLF